MSDRTRADAVYAALLTRQGEQWVQPRVERTRRVLELLGDPQSTYRVIHVTGTNGKTSTARIAESIIRAHGLRTGLFTSPHLERFTERIMIDGEPIDDGLVADAWDEVEPFIDLVLARGDVRFTWVKGHGTDTMNQLVDRLAVEASHSGEGRTSGDVKTPAAPVRPEVVAAAEPAASQTSLF